MRPCLLLVLRNQESLLSSLLAHLQPLGIPTLVVDAGSQAIESARLEEAASQQGIELIRLVGSSGKGIALRVGLDEAQRLGYTHVLQHDVDITFDVSELEAMLAAADAAPDTLFHSIAAEGSTGNANFPARLARLATGHPELARLQRGAMLFPIGPINHLLSQNTCCSGEGINTEVLIRWQWRKLPRQGFPLTRLSTEHRRVSNAWEHTIQLAMYARIGVGMLLRAPILTRRAWLKHQRNSEEKSA